MEHVTLTDIQQKIDWVLDSPADHGRVESIVVRPTVNNRTVLQHALFSPAAGVEGDNWLTHCWKKRVNGQPDPDVQVAIMNARMIKILTQDKTRWSLAGDQLFVDLNLGIQNLAPGDRLRIANTLLEITAEPHRGCRKFKDRFGETALDFVNSPLGDAHRLRGIYAKIITAGEVRVGDVIEKI